MKNKKGFTLVELIVVMAITTILFGTIVSIFLLSVEMYKTDETKSSNQTSLNLATTRLDASIRKATDVYYDGSGCHMVNAAGEDLFYLNTSTNILYLNASSLTGRIASFSCSNVSNVVTISVSTINDSKGLPLTFSTTIVLRKGE